MATEIVSNAQLGRPLVIGVDEFEGDIRLDIRHNYKEADTDALRPTTKGINMPLSEGLTFIHDLVDAYNDATGSELSLS